MAVCAFLFYSSVSYAASRNALHVCVLVMAVGALIGGSLGGRLAGKIKPSTLRWIVVSIGFIVAIIYFIT